MKSKKHITITQAKLEKIKVDIARKVFDKAVQVFMLALHDEFGFGPQRMEKLLVRVHRYSQSIDNHLVGMKEMETMWNKATGFTMEEVDKRR